MNGRGAYSGVIAIAVLAVVTAFSFSALSIANSESVSVFGNSVRELKADWLNAMFLVDKAVAKAVGDAAAENFSETGICGFDGTRAFSNISTSLAFVAGNSFKKCSITSSLEELDLTSPAVKGSIMLRCENAFGDYNAVFEKAVLVDKELRTQLLSPAPNQKNCVIEVVDNKGSASALDVSRTESKVIEEIVPPVGP